MRATTRRVLLAMIGNLEKVRADIERMHFLEKSDHNNKTNKWQESEAGKRHLENLSELDQIKGYLEDAINSADNLTEKTVNTK